MKLRSRVKLLDVRDRKKGKFGSTKRSLCESFMTKSSSGRSSVRSWWKECAFFFNKLQGSVYILARVVRIYWIVHGNFNEQNNSLILILLNTCLLTFINTGLLKLGSRGRSLEMHVFTSLIFRRGGCGVHQVLFSDRVNLPVVLGSNLWHPC